MTSYFVLAQDTCTFLPTYKKKLFTKINIQTTSSSVQNTSVVSDEPYQNLHFLLVLNQ